LVPGPPPNRSGDSRFSCLPVDGHVGLLTDNDNDEAYDAIGGPYVPSSDQVAEYPEGNNIYLVASQGVRAMTDMGFGDTPDTKLEAQLDSAVTLLQDWVVENDAIGVAETPDVVRPADEFDFSTDCSSQCSGGTETGQFDGRLSYIHHYQALPCAGDTVVSKYVFEIDTADGTLDNSASKLTPSFDSISDRTAEFDGLGSGPNVWTDVDPLDGTPTATTRGPRARSSSVSRCRGPAAGPFFSFPCHARAVPVPAAVARLPFYDTCPW
jgi:hypothetical protein